MPQEFDGLADFIRFLGSLPVAIRSAEQRGRRAAVEVVRREVVGILGEYQAENTGPFPAWQALAQQTQERREKAGFEPDAPEFVTGALLDSVTGAVESDGRAAVGVASEMVGNGSPGDEMRDIGAVAVAQEFGTDKVPQRSFLGVGAFRSAERAAEVFTAPVIRAVTGLPPTNQPAEVLPHVDD